MKKLILIDGYSLFFRAFYATAYTGNFMMTSTGLPTNAVYSFSTMIFRILSEHDFTHILVALDSKGKTFRHELFTDYKGTRGKAPDELLPQFDMLPALLDALRVKYYKKDKYEADDIIGTLAQEAEKAGYTVNIFSSDRDLLQLLDENTSVQLLKKGLTDVTNMTPAVLEEEMGITPAQVPDLKGLMGDSADNIPGVPGIGPKTATKLLSEYGTVENLYKHIDKLKGKQKENLITNEAQARLSKELATIICDLPLELELPDLAYEGIDLQATQQFFRQIEANTLVRKAQSVYDMQEAREAIDTSELLDGLLQDVAVVPITLADAAEPYTFSAETVLYLEHPWENYHEQREPLYVGVKTNDDVYIFSWSDFKANESIVAWLRDGAYKKITFDSKKLSAICRYAGLELAGVNFDIMLGAYLLNPSAKVNELAEVAQSFEYSLPFQENIYGKGAKFSVEDRQKIIEYTYTSVEMATVCTSELKGALADSLMKLLLDMELPVARILTDMEVEGVRVDANLLKEQGKVITERIQILEAEIYELAGETFNISSPRQLGVILFEKLSLRVIKKTKTGYSTANDVLEELLPGHPIIALIIEYRQLTKLDSTYIKGLIPMIADDGKIHTIYKQTQAQTGRLSSIEPNLQNIPIRLPEGRLIRKAFIPNTINNVLVASDYSQIELRILAHLANVPELIAAFQNNRDIHRETAMKIFDVADDAVTDLMRSQAKSVNFGIIYGMSDFGLATQLGITRAEAKQFIEKYFSLFPGVQEYMKRTIAKAEDQGYVETMFGRRRYFPGIHSRNFNERNFAKRAAMNAPLQGSAADILKVAMMSIDKALKSHHSAAKMLLQVHDELIFDVPQTEVVAVTEMIREAMVGACEMSVPLAVSISAGSSWYDAK